MAAIDVLRKAAQFGDNPNRFVSQNVYEAMPSLALPTPGTDASSANPGYLDFYAKMSELSPELKQQQSDLLARKKAQADAYTQEDPLIKAQKDQEQANKLALQGESARVAGEQARALDKQKFEENAPAASANVDAWLTAIANGTPLTQVPAAVRSSVVAKGAEQGVDFNTMTNQTRQMSETANDLIPMIDQIQEAAQSLKKAGAFGLLSSPIREFLVNHGAGTLMGYGPDVAGKIGQFQTILGLLQSGVARAHAGARGAGNTQMAERFEKLMNASGDLPTFLGQLQGVRDLLSIYGRHTNPGLTNVPATEDPYADPNYQPQ